MKQKKRADNDRLVYSTDPDFKQHSDEIPEEPTLEPAKQMLKLKLDSKQRGGKTVTLVEGFRGLVVDLETLGKQLKTFCGTGGSVKEGQIIIQGDQRQKLLQYLVQKGYRQTRQI